MDAATVMRSVVLALVCLATLVRGQGVEVNWNAQYDANPGGELTRGYRFKTVSGSKAVWYKLNGTGSGIASTATEAGNVQAVSRQALVSWSGLSDVNTPVEGVIAAAQTTTHITVSTTASGGPYDVTVEMPVPDVPVHISYVSGGNTFRSYSLPPIDVIVGPDGSVTLEDPLEPEPDPEREFESGILLLDNLTGDGLEVDFGGEALRLQPGYNAFPFHGETEGGFPAAIGDDWQLTRVDGADGQTYWVGRIAGGSEGGPEWVTPPSAGEIQITPPQTGQTGPVVKLPNGVTAGSLQDYVTLPPGMRKGNNLPLPGGMTPGSPGLPPGVTPGSLGALPKGVISGGTVHLPPGMSAGTPQGNQPPDPTKPKESTGGKNPGAIVQSDSGGEDDAGPYVGGASMDGLLEEGRQMGQDAAAQLGSGIGEGLEALGEAMQTYGEGGFRFWEAPQASFFGGSDKSWLNFEIPLGSRIVPVEVPENIISLIREILLWMVKIWFVIACIRLVMK